MLTPASVAREMAVLRRQVDALDQRPLRYVPPCSFARDAGIEPDSWQEDVLTSEAPRLSINACRQSGKSTIVAILAMHTALYTPSTLILLLSPSLRQSGEIFAKCRAVYDAVERPVLAINETALTLRLANGSRIVSLPGSSDGTIRGYSGVGLLIVDEASRVRDDLYMSCRPMLAVSGGRLVTLSTPYGTRGWWFAAWRSAEPWERYEVPATQCDRIPPEFLAEEERTMGRLWFESEYLCQFVDAQSQAFSRDEIDSAFVEDVDAWDFSEQFAS